MSDDSVVKMDIWGPDVASNRLKIDHCIAIYYQSFGLVYTDRFCNDRYFFVCQSKSDQKIGCQPGYSGLKCDQCATGYVLDETDQVTCKKETSLQIGSKVLAIGGHPVDISETVEIVDLKNASFKCNNLKPFPRQVYDTIGGLLDGKTPIGNG